MGYERIEQYLLKAIKLTNEKNATPIARYLGFLMHFTYEMTKGAKYDIEYFLKHDEEKNWRNWYNFAQYAEKYFGDKELAIKCFQKCIKLNSKRGMIYKNYGSCLLNFGMYQDAINIFDNCNKIKYQDYGVWQYLCSLVY